MIILDFIKPQKQGENIMTQEQIRKETKATLNKQERLRKEIKKLGERLAELEELCRLKHIGLNCIDCSWEAE